MTQQFLAQMTSLGYTEAEAQAKWAEAMSKVDSVPADPVFTAMAAMYPDDAAAREAYALSQIEGLPPKSAASAVPSTISSNPLHNDSTGAGSNVPSAVPATTRRSDVQTSKYSPPSIENDELRQRVNETLAAMRTEKHNRTAVSSIVKVLVKSPDPSTYLKTGDTPKNIMISTDMEKISKFEASLEPTEENLAAYRSLKTAADSKSLVPVYINDENNRRIIGVVINTLGPDGKQQDMTLSAKNLEAFLLGQVSGIITNGQAYVRLANWKKKVSMKSGHASTAMTLTVQWTKKGLFWEKGMVDSVSVPMTAAQASEIGASQYESRTVKTAASFVVVEPNPNPVSKLKNPTRKRTIRFSGPCEEIPRFKMKPEYENKGISIGSSTTFISPNMTAADAARYDEQFATLMMGVVSGDKFSQVDVLAEISPDAYATLNALRKSAVAAGAGAYEGM
jgi:hypothetical protein